MFAMATFALSLASPSASLLPFAIVASWAVAIVEEGNIRRVNGRMTPSVATAAFEAFTISTTFKGITHAFFQLCVALDVDPTDQPNIYNKIRVLNDWKAQKLFKLLDKRRQQSEYCGGKAANHLNALVIGAGPCGLRSAIECALLGCRVIVVEARDKFSRNNVLHLWEFVIADLKSLGAKFFYPKFCTGSIEHISIRQLQCCLLKVALLFGVQVYDSVSFSKLRVPEGDSSDIGFRAVLDPPDHILSSFSFDVLIGADGKRNTVPGFPRDEMRGKLAIGITANYENGRTPLEERVSEISGVAYIFNQSFFKEMYEMTGVDLENIVYYKDETHYFVMCAKKSCLIEKGVIKSDSDDVAVLLSSSNVDEDALCHFATAAADFATRGALPTLNFATNQRGRPDVAMFDFTSLFSSKYSVRLLKKGGRRLLMAVVGDSLHEPFWPTGSGCARGFLGVWDTAWLIRQLAVSGREELELIAERESVYRLLAQCTKDNMHKKVAEFTIDPRTRYISPEMNVRAEDVKGLVMGGEGHCAPFGQARDDSFWKILSVHRFAVHSLAACKLRIHNLAAPWRDGRALGGLLSKFLPDSTEHVSLIAMEDDDRIQKCLSVAREQLGVEIPAGEWKYLPDDTISEYIVDIVTSIRAEKARTLKALTPKITSLKRKNPIPRVDASKARKTAPIARLAEDLKACSTYHPSTENVSRDSFSFPTSRVADRISVTALVTPIRNRSKETLVEKLDPDLLLKVNQIVNGRRMNEESIREKGTARLDRGQLEAMEEKMKGKETPKRSHLTGQEEKMMRARVADVRKEAEDGFEKRADKEKYREIDESLRRSELRLKQKDMAGLTPIRSPRSMAPPPPPMNTPVVERCVDRTTVRMRIPSSTPRRVVSMAAFEPARNSCAFCDDPVYLAERVLVEGMTLHRSCFRCTFCSQPLRLGECSVNRDIDKHRKFRLYCKTHDRLPLKEKVSQIERNEKRRRGVEKAASVDYGKSVTVATPLAPPAPSTPLSPRRHTVTVNLPAPVVEENSHVSRQSSSSTSLFFFTAPESQASERNGGGREEASTVTSLESETMMTSRELEEGEEPPERAEFSILEPHGKLSPSTSLEDELEEERDDVIEIPDDSESECEEDEEEEVELEEEDLAELDKTVVEMETDGTTQCSEMQALSIINVINRRRSSHLEVEPDGLRERKEEELEERRSEARRRAKMKSDEQLGLPPSSLDRPRAHSATEGGQGLLSRLFSPPSAGPAIHADLIHIESEKESALKSRSYRKMKHSRGGSEENTGIVSTPVARPSAASPVVTPMAIVAPSPRPSSVASTRLSTDRDSIRYVQRKVEKMKRQRADDRKRQEQDIQRGLAECETRLEEVEREGTRLEKRLSADPTSTASLEKWYTLTQQRSLLRQKEMDLELQAKAMAADEHYKELSRRFRETERDVEDETVLLEEMLVALRGRGTAQAELDAALKTPNRIGRLEAPHLALQRHGYNYLNFRPVFLSH